MDDEEEQFCKNCKRAVSSANFASHSAFCERQIFVCEVCDEPVLISRKKEHVEEYHQISPCDLCDTAIEKWMLPKHMEEICPKRPIICRYCEADFPANEYDEHIEFCGSRTEKCLICRKYVMNKEKEEHSKFHRYEKEINAKKFHEEIQQNKVNEVVCRNNTTENISEKTSVRKYVGYEETINYRHDPKTMLSSFEEAKASVPDKPCSYVRRNEQGPEIQSSEGAVACLPTRNKEKHYGQCHICKQEIPWIDMNTHIPSCASLANRCSVCGVKVSSSTIKDHMKEHIDNSQKSPLKVPQNHEPFSNSSRNGSDKIQDSNKMTCPFCSRLLRSDEILEHSRNCSKTMYECPLCCEKIQEKDKFKHQKSECRMIHAENDRNTSSYSRLYYECSLCSENVPEEDRERHTTFDCSSLLQSSGSYGFLSMRGDATDMYECPLCLKRMLAKDKGYHESFECKVLIEACGENIPEPRSYSEVTKKACACSCKSKQNSSEICFKCKNRISEQKKVEHKKYCHQEKIQSLSKEEMHLKYCPGQDTRTSNLRCHSKVPSSKTPYESKGAKPRLSDLKERMQPQTGKCKHCQTTLNIDILVYHEDECVHRLVECPECSKKICVKDLGVHQCSTKNKKGKKQKCDRQGSEDKEEPSLGRRVLNFFKPSSNLENDEGENVNRQYSSLYQQRSSYHGVPTVEQNEPLYFSGTDGTLIPCEFCGKKIPVYDIVLHETGCQPDLISYAKQDSSADTNKNTSTTNKESNSRPVRSNSSKKDSVSNDRLKEKHLVKETSSFFTRKNSPYASAEYISHTSKSGAEPGEFLQFFGKTSRDEESSELKRNLIKEKKEKLLNYQSVWNAETFKDSIVEDNDSQQISDQSDAEMEIDQPGNYPCMKNEMNRVEPEVLAKADSDITAMLMFLKNVESDEEYGAFSAIRHEMKPNSLETRDVGVDSNLLDTNQGKHEKDFAHPKKDVHEELVPSSGKIGHKLIPIEHKFEEPEKICGEDSRTDFSDEVEEINNYKKRFPDFKFSSKENQSLVSKDNKRYAEVSIKTQEVGKLKEYPLGSISKQFDDINIHRDYLSDFKQLKDFKFDIDKSKLSSEEIGHQISHHVKSKQDISKHIRGCNDEEESISDFNLTDKGRKSFFEGDNIHSTIQPEKNNKEPEKLFKQQPDKSLRDLDSKKQKDYMNSAKGLTDFKFGLHMTTALSSEEKVHQRATGGKKEEPEKLSKENSCHYDYSHYLPNFKYGACETKFLASKNDFLSDFTEKSNEQTAFNFKPTTSLQKETGDSKGKDKRKITDLDEKIAKLQMSSLKDNVDEGGTDAYSRWRKDFYMKDIAKSEGERLKSLQDNFQATKAEYDKFIKNIEQQTSQLYDLRKRNNELNREIKAADLMKKEYAVPEDKEKKEHLGNYYHETQPKWQETQKEEFSSDND